MKALVTGASGFLGRHIADRLQQEGVEITALVRPTSSVEYLKEKGVGLITGDIRNEADIAKAVKGMDVVVHAATSKGGRWDDFYEENVKGIERLLKASVKNKVGRFVFISSVAVLDHSSVKNGHTFPEDAPFEADPMTHYSRSKAEAEKLVARYHQEHGLNTVILRPACLFGPGGGMNKLYPSRLGFSAGANAYAVLGGGKSVVPLSHVRSVAEAIWLSIRKDAAVGKSYNVVEDEPITRLEFLKFVKEGYKSRLKIKKIPFWMARLIGWTLRILIRVMGKKAPSRIQPLYLRLFALSLFYTNEPLKKDLGWKPVPDVRKSIRETMRYYADRRVPRSVHLVPRGKVTIESGETLHVAVAGCGNFAKTHLRTLKQIRNVEVVALCDPDPGALESMARLFGVSRTYGSLTELLKNHQIDVVHVTSSAQTHAPLSIEAMNRGCHVIVEKPMAINSAEARQMIKVSEENNVRLCVGHSLLYDAYAVQARDLLNRGVLGDVIQVEGWFGTSYSSNRGSPYLRYEARDSWVYGVPGSLYQNFLSHPLSVVLDMMGPVQKVTAVATYNKIVPHMRSDELRILLKNENSIGTVSMSMGATPRQNFLKVYGTKGTLLVDFMYKYILLYKDVPMMPKVISRQLTAMKQARGMFFSGLTNLMKVITGKFNLFESNERLLRLFYKCLLDGDPLPVSLQNGLESMEVMDEVWKQIKV